eukprot:1007000_1
MQIIYHVDTRQEMVIYVDPRCDNEMSNAIELRYTPHALYHLYGLPSYLEPIVTACDINGGLSASNMYDSFLFTQNWKLKHCVPMMIYDRFTQMLYDPFITRCKQCIMHKTRMQEASNESSYFSKHRMLNTGCGGKLIYSSIASKPKGEH